MRERVTVESFAYTVVRGVLSVPVGVVRGICKGAMDAVLDRGEDEPYEELQEEEIQHVSSESPYPGKEETPPSEYGLPL